MLVTLLGEDKVGLACFCQQQHWITSTTESVAKEWLTLDQDLDLIRAHLP